MYLNIQKNLKFKLDGLSISASVEEPYCPKNVPETPTLHTLHYHVIHELFIISDVPLTFYSEQGTIIYKNCILCVPPGLKHRTSRQYGLRILFTFDKDNKASEFSAFMQSFSMIKEPFVLQYTEELSFYITQLTSLFNYDTSLSNEICISILKLIFYTIFWKSNMLKSPLSKKPILSTPESYFSIIDGIINNLYRQDVSLKKAADILSLSTKQASRVIKKNYGKTLSQLICEKRLSVAAELLICSEKNINEIVEYVNFPSESYFYRKFKEAYKVTPTKYKKSIANRKTDALLK